MDQATPVVFRFNKELFGQNLLIQHATLPLAGQNVGADGWKLLVDFLIGVVLIPETTFKSAASPRNFIWVKRGFLDLRHLHGYRRHFAQMGVAADRFATVTIIRQKFSFVPYTNLSHLNSGLQVGGQEANQFPEINTLFSKVINNDPLTAEKLLDVNQLHLQFQVPDVLPANFEDLVSARLNMSQFVLVIVRQRTQDLSLLGLVEVAQRIFGRLAQDITDFHAAFGTSDHAIAPRQSVDA